MTYSLFIDDERVPMDVTWCSGQERHDYIHGDWLIAREWNEVLEIVLTYGFPSVISFDHDLGNNTRNGYEIAQKLCDMVLDGVEMPKDFRFLVHSKNPVGAENIRKYMDNFLKHWGN